MARPATLAASALALCLLLAPPGLAWYKPAAGRSSYSVGRAAGLLSGFHRSPYARRSQPPRGAEPPGRAGASPELQLHPRLLSLPLLACPRLCASRTSPRTCRGASGSPTAAGPTSARRTSSCPCAQPTASPPEPGPQTPDPDLSWHRWGTPPPPSHSGTSGPAGAGWRPRSPLFRSPRS
ncbi:neuropeptide B isoform X1 [Pongo pygmaeus]|uniref:neuropeptide B isoform X1 n=1 Tax=Pongo pygmaeus TaxID=9600 RepID=UPI0023E0E13D|nr:neuropeptide B isoform X1 [Pongo pygmaeus]